MAERATLTLESDDGRWWYGQGKVWRPLAPEQRDRLQHLVRAGKGSARVIIRARILLKTDEGWSAPQVAEALDVAEGTVFRIKRRFAEEGLEGVLKDRSQAHRYRKLDDRVRLTWSRWPAAQRRRGMTTGPCACWLARSSSWGWRPPCPTKGCASVSKKRSSSRGRSRSGASPR